MRGSTWRGCVALLCVCTATLGLDAGSARAVSEFGSSGTEAGQFIEPNGIAIDQESGDVYVLDTNNDRVEKFTKEGVFLLAWGWGVTGGRTPGLQTCTTATRCSAGSSGSGAGQLNFAEGIAVDNDPQSPSHHDVYVVDIFNHRVQKFSPTGRFLLMFGGQVNDSAHARGETSNEDVCPIEPGDRCGEGRRGGGGGQFEFRVEGNFIAVGATGTVYVGDRDRVEEFDQNGTYQSQVKLSPDLQGEGEKGGTIALAVGAAGDLYAIRNGVSGIQEYTPQGALLQTLNEEAPPENNESPTPALTLDPHGDVFVDYHYDEQHRLLEYNSTGAEIASFDEGEADGLHGLAYSDVVGRLYVVSAAIPRVRIVAPPPLTSFVFSGLKILPWLIQP
jgi:tripartite motif-containing protein 71